jgi:uncharacterized membrane protein YkvA (DUF1232 family)
MPFKPNAQHARSSSAFRRANIQAKELLSNPDRLRGVVDDALRKAERYKEGPLREIWHSLSTAFRLIKAYANGSYRAVPWESMSLLVAAVVYLLMPIDLIPDFIVGLGLLDDVALFGWVLRCISTELDAFAKWETGDQAEQE